MLHPQSTGGRGFAKVPNGRRHGPLVISRLARTDDTGASLVIALIIITVVAIVVGAVLALSGTNEKATIALRDQATQGAAAAGAANVAINAIRKGSFPGNNCTAANSLPLDNFYLDDGTTKGGSARVECKPDPANVGDGGGANSSPGSALLTLGTSPTEHGIYLDSSNNESFKVHGGVFSNSDVYLTNNKSNLENNADDSYVFVMGDCTLNGSNIIRVSPLTGTATTCNYKNNPVSSQDRRGWDPRTVPGHGTSFDPPTLPTTSGSVSPASCSGKKVYEFQPGAYNDANVLNALTNAPKQGSCAGSVWHFNPGTYYFNFTNASGGHKWTIGHGFLVGGTANPSIQPFTVAKVKAATGTAYCVAPGTTGSSTSSGVMFVFGGDSRMDIHPPDNSVDGPSVQICGSNASSGPPIAIYGLASTATGCVSSIGYVTPGDATHCALIQTYNDPFQQNGPPSITVYGTTYVPGAVIDLYLNNNTIQVFRWGLVARAISLHSTGSTSSLINAVIDVPDDAPAPFALPSAQYLKVYVCGDGATSCATGGQLALTVKLEVSGTLPRTVTILSWSVQ